MGGRDRGSGKENPKQNSCWTQSPTRGSVPGPHDRPEPETKSWMLNKLCHLCDLIIIFFSGQRTWIDFSKEDIQTSNKQMKRCSTSLSLMKSQSNHRDTTLHPARWLLSKKWQTNQLARMERNRNPWTLLMGIWNDELAVANWLFLKKVYTELSKDPAIPLLGTYSKRTENRYSERDLFINAHSSTSHNSQKA